MLETLNIKLSADYRQFYLIDEDLNPDSSDIWTREASEHMLALTEGLVSVGTARDMEVPVILNIYQSKPVIKVERYNKVNECSIYIPSGSLVLMGCLEDFDEAKRLKIDSGIYRLFVKYANLGKISEDGFDGDDFYEIDIWPYTRKRDWVVIK